MHGLRKALGAERIETHGTGYRLALEPGELDLERFETLVGRPARELGAGRADCGRRSARGARALARAGRSPTSPRSRSPRPSGTGSRSCGCARSSFATTPSSRSAATTRSSGRARGARRRASVSASASARSRCWRSTARAGRRTRSRPTGRRAAARRRARDRARPELQELERAVLRQDPALAAPGSGRISETRLPGAADRRSSAGSSRSPPFPRCFAARRGSSRSPARAAPARPGSRSRWPRSSPPSCGRRCFVDLLRCAIRRCSPRPSRRRSASRTASDRRRRRSRERLRERSAPAGARQLRASARRRHRSSRAARSRAAPGRARDEPRAAAALRRARVSASRR